MRLEQAPGPELQDRRCAHNSIIALTTPVSGRIHSGNRAGASSRLTAMGDQPLDLDAARADRRQHLAEILDRGVAAALERQLALVEVGVGEADVGADHAHEHQRAAMRHPAEALLHRPGVAGGVEHEVEEVAAGEVAQAARPCRRPPASLHPDRGHRGRKPAGRRAGRGRSTSAPRALANRAVAMPIGPAPTTSVRSPPRISARLAAWAPIARNSTSAAWSSGSPSVGNTSPDNSSGG